MLGKNSNLFEGAQFCIKQIRKEVIVGFLYITDITDKIS